MSYPINSQSEMVFNSGVFTFRLARADNGVIFEEYNAMNDTLKRLVAVDRVGLLALFDRWSAERRAQLEAAKDIFPEADNGQ